MYVILNKLLPSGLLSKLLLASPDARITIADIQKDRWFTQGKSRYQYDRIKSTLNAMFTFANVCVSVQV